MSESDGRDDVTTGNLARAATARAEAPTPRGVVRAGNQAQQQLVELAATSVAEDARDNPSVELRGSGVGTSSAGQNSARAAVTAAEAATEANPEESLVGSHLAGRYQIIRKVGQGGMGVVYEATHTLIGKRVAVKVLLEKFAKRNNIVARLEQEARLASSIGHEHIIDINDFGTTEDGRTFVVMEFLEGESLAECLAREQTLSESRILHIALQAASALAAAHDKGIVHRDIKPENLFLVQRKGDDFVKVVDFGISKSLQASDETATQRLTQTGMVLGTPLYMSPEQASGEDVIDARVDVYALGVIMYEAATGRVPFLGPNYLSVISQVLNDEPKPVRALRPEISDEFEALVMRAMAKDRNERYASAKALLADIDVLLSDPTRSTARARITAPARSRKMPKRGGTKVLIWVAAIAVLVAAVTVIVTSMLSSSDAVKNSRKSAPAAVAAVPVVPAPDAAITVKPADASDVARTIEISIRSEPAGAEIWEGGRQWGSAPLVYRAAKDSAESIALVAKMDGYEDTPFTVRPLIDNDPARPVVVRLAKTVKPSANGNGKRVVPRGEPGTANGSATDKRDPAAGGELQGNPFKSGN